MHVFKKFKYIFHSLLNAEVVLLYRGVFVSNMRGRGMLVAQGLIARGSRRGANFNEALKCKPLVFSCQSRTVSTAQEKADTRAMLDRMLRFGVDQFKRHTS